MLKKPRHTHTWNIMQLSESRGQRMLMNGSCSVSRYVKNKNKTKQKTRSKTTGWPHLCVKLCSHRSLEENDIDLSGWWLFFSLCFSVSSVSPLSSFRMFTRGGQSGWDVQAHFPSRRRDCGVQQEPLPTAPASALPCSEQVR